VIATKALGIKPGDQVITTVFSWIATSAAITAAGGKVVFCDIEKIGYLRSGVCWK
jgi:dTDP-4-amino-4,6-dideoxygalactose transaminase